MGTEDADAVVKNAEVGALNPIEILERYLDHLSAKGLAPGTQRLYATVAKKFFEVNVIGREINWDRIEMPRLYRNRPHPYEGRNPAYSRPR